LEQHDATIGLHNIFAGIPATSPTELYTTLLESPGVRIERIVSYGQVSPEGFWYDQDQGEWVIVLQGAAKLEFEDRVVEMTRVDFVHIRAHEKHRVAWTTPDEPTIWLAVHFENSSP
jgi:cupin 2 domain-containing protein